MTEDQRQSVIKTIDELLQADVSQIAKEYYDDQDVRHVTVGDFKLPEVTGMLNRALKQLISEMNGGNWRLLPFNYTEPGASTTSLTAVLSHISSYLTSQYKFDNWLPQLLWLVRYEMQFGFWDRSKLRLHNVDELNISQAREELKIIKGELEKKLGEINELYNQLETSKEELDDYKTQKQTEYKQLTTNQELSSKSLAAIRDDESEASANQASITAILEQQKILLDDSRKNIAEDRARMETIDQRANKIMSEALNWIEGLENYDKQFSDVVANATAKETEILGKNERIEELLGFASDAALGHTFGRRQKALVWPVRVWAALSFCAGGFALWWILHIFQLYPPQKEANFDWMLALLNVLRTSPALYILYFAVSQYNKERNLQEDYAFKTAVSMTVTAYSNMIDAGADRTAMLISTIQSIYAAPNIGKDSTPLIFSTKHLADATKNVADAAASVKSTATNLTSAVKAEVKKEEKEKGAD